MSKKASKPQSHLKKILRRKRRNNLHLVCGGGGTRAILATSGAIAALHTRGVANWVTAGGISGGAIPALLVAAGIHPKKMLRMALDSDFSNLLVKERSPQSVLRAYLRQKKTERLPLKAMLSSQRLGDYIDSVVKVWPAGFWTMASANIEGKGRCQVFFTSKGVFQYFADGSCVQILDKPAALGLAIRATCAVPGVIEPIPFEGMLLYDGMLSWDGRCTVGAVRKHFKVHPRNIVACDVGDGKSLIPGLENRYMDYWCGDACDEVKTLDYWHSEGVSIISAPVTEFGSLKLDLTVSQKRGAIRKGLKSVNEASQAA